MDMNDIALELPVLIVQRKRSLKNKNIVFYTLKSFCLLFKGIKQVVLNLEMGSIDVHSVKRKTSKWRHLGKNANRKTIQSESRVVRHHSVI